MPETANLLDCAAPCLLTASSDVCDFFVFEPNTFCYLGAFDKTDGAMESSATSFHIYANRGELAIIIMIINMIIRHFLLLGSI